MDQDVRRRVDTAVRNLEQMNKILAELSATLKRCADSLERLAPPATPEEENDAQS